MSTISLDTLRLLRFILDDSDVVYLDNLSKLLSDEERSAAHDSLQKDCGCEFAAIDPLAMTIHQRLVLTAYAHLYGALYQRDLAGDTRLRRLRNKLRIESNFVDHFAKHLRHLDQNQALNGRPAILAISMPTETTVNWINTVVIEAAQHGVYCQRVPLTSLRSRTYEHPLDREALRRLENTAGLDRIVRAFNQHGLDRWFKVQYMGSYIKASDRSYPQLIGALCEVCEILDVSPVPELYIQPGFINASTTGVEQPLITISTAAVALLSHNELRFVLGHEVGHIKSQHILYHQMAHAFPVISDLIGAATLMVGKLLSTGLEIALLNWYRISEYTADRAGLLACQNFQACITALMKLAGVPPTHYASMQPNEFMQQANTFDSMDENNLDTAVKFLAVLGKGHPWTVMRTLELQRWVESGDYLWLLKNYDGLE